MAAVAKREMLRAEIGASTAEQRTGIAQVDQAAVRQIESNEWRTITGRTTAEPLPAWRFVSSINESSGKNKMMRI
jgi:hypothetical protein